MMDTKFNVEINGIGFSEAVLTKSSSAGLRALYGSIANFTISPQGITKSSSESTTVENKVVFYEDLKKQSEVYDNIFLDINNYYTENIIY